MARSFGYKSGVVTIEWLLALGKQINFKKRRKSL